MNALRVPYKAHTSVVGFASEGSALRSMWRSHGLQPVGAPLLLCLPFKSFHEQLCLLSGFHLLGDDVKLCAKFFFTKFT